MRRSWLCGSAVFFLLSSAHLGSPSLAGAGALPHDAQVVLSHPDEYAGDQRVGAYVSRWWGFSTVSYWIEGPTGLLFIDTSFCPRPPKRR